MYLRLPSALCVNSSSYCCLASLSLLSISSFLNCLCSLSNLFISFSNSCCLISLCFFILEPIEIIFPRIVALLASHTTEGETIPSSFIAKYLVKAACIYCLTRLSVNNETFNLQYLKWSFSPISIFLTTGLWSEIVIVSVVVSFTQYKYPVSLFFSSFCL